MKYRAEIDGLRAVAVLPVIFFHAGFEWFGGGFVGVDIFFVISGYLITTIILSEMTAGNFTLVNFYERRARRILPALFFVMVVCLPLAWIILTPSYLKDFGQSLVAVSTFSSNILFWMESGYFASAAELKPLLHTWSLAVEEQYYILFPIFMILTWRLGIKWISFILVLLFVISLASAEWAVSKYPGAAFYLLPTRGWELLVGVFAAFYLIYSRHICSNELNQILSLIGFGMIVYSVIVFDKSTPFPSFYTLVPTIGTLLLILHSVPKTFMYNFLSFKPLVLIGLMSYSAYLWHQPLLAFARHIFVGEESDILVVILCLCSLVMAWFSLRFVETPFRNKAKISRSMVFKTSILGILIFSSLGFMLHMTNGLESLKLSSFSKDEIKNYNMVMRSSGYDSFDRMYSSDCKFWNRNTFDIPISKLDECSKSLGSPIVVLGDSHAMNIYNILAQSNAFPFIIGLAKGGCRPLSNEINCHYERSIEYLKSISKFNPKVIYHQAGSYFYTDEKGSYKPPLTEEIFLDKSSVERVASYIKKIKDLGFEIVWLGPFTEYGITAHRQPTKIKDIPDYNFKVFSDIEKLIFLTLGNDSSFNYVSFNNFYNLTSKVVFEDCLIWRDEDHFSTCGEEYISRHLNLDALQAN